MQLQLIEVAIGLVAAFFVVSVMASALVELGSVIFKKRSKDLRIVLETMLSTGHEGALDLESTSVWQVVQAASRRKRGWKDHDDRTPSYLSARSFADAVIEGLTTLKKTAGTVDKAVEALPDGPLKDRLQALRSEVGDDLVAVKAGLERWFDDTMDRLQGAYKRWSQWFLLFFGLLFAVVLNVSAVRIVDGLWNDATLRTAVADSATTITSEPCPTKTPSCTPEQKLDHAIANLDSLKLPVGWGKGWSESSGAGWTLLGMIPTGFAVMLGAPFWFDILSRLVGARGNRGVPPRADADTGSATAIVASAGANRVALPFFAGNPVRNDATATGTPPVSAVETEQGP